jgi:hypothetical protein
MFQTVAGKITETVDMYRHNAIPVALTLASGRQVAGPVLSCDGVAIALDPEALVSDSWVRDPDKLIDGWVDRYTVVDLRAVVMVTYA